MTVYLDIIWLLNFLVDSLLLWFTAIFLKKHAKVWRIVTGGLVGSSMILLSITPYTGIVNHPMIKFAVSICMVWIVFGYKRFKMFCSSLLTFYFATFLMGGILIGTHFFLTFDVQLRTAVVFESLRGFGDPVSWLFIMISFPIAWHFSKRRIEELTISNYEADMLTNITIRLNGIVMELTGLIDSGNQLYDPISKAPVMVVSTEALKDKLPDEILSIADDDCDPYELVGSLPQEWSTSLRLIPAKTLGKSQQLLCAFKPEEILLDVNGDKMIVSKALLIFTNQKLSSDQTFQCIIHPHMVNSAVDKSVS